MREGYSICLNEWALDKDIKNELGLLLIISSLTAEKGYCYASNEFLAEMFNTDTTQISKKIAKLVKKGYLIVDYKKRGTEIISREIRLSKMTTDHCQKRQPTDVKNDKENIISIKNNICSSDEERDNQISLSGNEKTEETKQEMSDEEKFEELWKIYPRKQGKNEAFRHYRSWLKGKEYCGQRLKLTPRQMWFAICKYRDYLRENKVDKNYIQMGSTFFNSTIHEYLATEEEIEAHTR